MGDSLPSVLNGGTGPKLIIAAVLALGVYFGELRSEVASASRERQDLKVRLVRIELQLTTMALAAAPRLASHGPHNRTRASTPMTLPTAGP